MSRLVSEVWLQRCQLSNHAFSVIIFLTHRVDRNSHKRRDLPKQVKKNWFHKFEESSFSGNILLYAVGWLVGWSVSQSVS